MNNEKIDPKKVMQELSVAELCETAEKYFAAIPDPTFQMAKPFADVVSTPELLYKMGLLLSGLRLGKSMVVLDFGAGTCWFSRLLNQMQCITISVDPSTTALDIGKRLFDEFPIVGDLLHPPRFIPFDGQKIDLPDNSVDRIVSFDAFHHVPNQEQVLREFYRVLKNGGIIGFSEPGIFHSQAAQSQYEMRNYNVLENDIRLDEIKELAEAIGFGELRLKLLHAYANDLNYTDYIRMTNWRLMPLKVWRQTTTAMRNGTVFYFTKGTYTSDSRSHIGLNHTIQLLQHDKTATVNEPFHLTVRLHNTGSNKWLHKNIEEIGVVKVGVHLYDAAGNLLDLDFGRSALDADVPPGQSVDNAFSLTFSQPGRYALIIDLVAERVCWFENLGCHTQSLEIEVLSSPIF